MAFPSKLHGFRRLTLNAFVYRWRLELGYPGSTITVVREQEGGSRLVVQLPSFRDMWIHYPTACTNDPRIVTPGFVGRAIQAALDEKWSPAARGRDFTLFYVNRRFELADARHRTARP